MKKILIACLCMLLCIGFCSCKSSEIEIPQGMQLASDENVPDYALFIPHDWNVEISTGTTAAYIKDQTNKVLATLTASFAVPVSADTTLENYFENYSSEFSTVFGSPEDFSEENTMLDGEAAKQYFYSASFGDVKYSFWQVICFHAGRVYTITYSSTEDFYETYAGDMQAIIENFSFKK